MESWDVRRGSRGAVSQHGSVVAKISPIYSLAVVQQKTAISAWERFLPKAFGQKPHHDVLCWLNCFRHHSEIHTSHACFLFDCYLGTKMPLASQLLRTVKENHSPYSIHSVWQNPSEFWVRPLAPQRPFPHLFRQKTITVHRRELFPSYSMPTPSTAPSCSQKLQNKKGDFYTHTGHR